MFLDDIVGPMSIEEHIGKVKGGYRLYSHKGKNLGTFPNKAAAEKHEREVQYFKHAGESVEEAKKERKTNDDLAQTSQNAGTRELINKARRSTPGARSEQDAITNYLNQQSDALAQAQDELEKQKTTNQQQTAQLRKVIANLDDKEERFKALNKHIIDVEQSSGQQLSPQEKATMAQEIEDEVEKDLEQRGVIQAPDVPQARNPAARSATRPAASQTQAQATPSNAPKDNQTNQSAKRSTEPRDKPAAKAEPAKAKDKPKIDLDVEEPLTPEYRAKLATQMAQRSNQVNQKYATTPKDLDMIQKILAKDKEPYQPSAQDVARAAEKTKTQADLFRQSQAQQSAAEGVEEDAFHSEEKGNSWSAGSGQWSSENNLFSSGNNPHGFSESDVAEGEHDTKFRDDEDSFYHMADFAHKAMGKGQSLQDVIQYLRDNNYLEPQEVNSFVKQVRGEKWNEGVTEGQYEIHHLDSEGRRKAIYHPGKDYTDDVVRQNTQYYQKQNPRDTFRVFKDKQPFDWQGVTEDTLNEFAPGDRDDGGDLPPEIHTLANRWWNATDDQPMITNVLRSMGWSIAQVESEDDAVQLQHRDGATYFVSADEFDPDLFEQGVTEAEGPGRVDPILYKALARMTKGGYDDAKIALAIEFGLLDMKHNYAIANNYIPKLVDLYNQKHGVSEEWSQKYKSSINCSHPKGFSQKAHCAGKKKHNESMEMVCEDCGMCQTHGSLNEIKKGAKDSNGFTKCWSGYHAAGTKKSATTGKQVRNCVPNEGVAESLEKHERYQYIVTLKSGKRIRFLCGADCDVKTYIERKYKEPVVDIKDQGIVGEPPVELLPGEIKEGSQSFHNGMQVKLTPEYADRPNEVFTVANCDRERGRCWIGDEQGRGWYASFDQLIPVEDDEVDEGWRSTLGAAALAGTMALGAGNAHGRVTPDQDPNINRLTGQPIATQQADASVDQEVKAPVASKGFSKEYLQKAADPNRFGRYLISVEKAQELLNQIKEGTNYWSKLQNERNTRINKLLSELQENIKDK